MKGLVYLFLFQQYILEAQANRLRISNSGHIFSSASISASLFISVRAATKMCRIAYHFLRIIVLNCRRRLLDSQRRVRRESPGSQAWQDVLRSEVEARVLHYMTPCDDIQSLLLQDIKEASLLQALQCYYNST